MPFTWNENLATGGKINSSMLQEIKTKTDSAATTIGIPKFSWTTKITAVAPGVLIKADQQTEIRNAIDYVHTNRTCSTHFTSVLTTYNSAQNSTFKSTVYATNYSNQNASYCDSQNTTVNSSNYSTENGTVYSDNYYAAKGSNDNTVYSSNYYAANSGHCATVYYTK